MSLDLLKFLLWTGPKQLRYLSYSRWLAEEGGAGDPVSQHAAAGSLSGMDLSTPLPLPCPLLALLHSISLLSTDGTQVSPGAHRPSPPGTGKSQA